MHWRVLAERMWTPQTVEAFHLDARQFKGQDRIRAARAKEGANEIHRILFEDD